jgi:hypothetical protein
MRSSMRPWSRANGKFSKSAKGPSWLQIIGSIRQQRGGKGRRRLGDAEEDTMGSRNELTEIHQSCVEAATAQEEQESTPYILKTVKVEQHQDGRTSAPLEKQVCPWDAE